MPKFLHVPGYEFSEPIQRNPEKELFILPDVLRAVGSYNSCVDMDCHKCPMHLYGVNFHDVDVCKPVCDDWPTTKAFLIAWIGAIKTPPSGQLTLF